MDEFVYITDSTYSRRQLAHMEHAFLKVLDFKMAAPTTHQFLSLFMSIHPVCAITENLALVSKIDGSNTVRTVGSRPFYRIFSAPSMWRS